jgi:phage-related protein
MNFVKNSINFNLGGKSVKTENDAIAPNGVKEATRFFSPADVKSTTFDTPLNPITFVTDKIYCRSIFVKPVSDNPEPRLLPFIIGGENTQHRLGIFNLKTKIFTWQYAQPGEVGTIFQANYKEYDNGWIRVWWNIKKTLTNTLGLNSYHMGGYGGGNNGSMWVWGAQVEEVANLSSEPGDYEPVGVKSLSTFYNRDSNIKLNLSDKIDDSDSLSSYYTPVYGSRVTFESRLNSYETTDGYYNTIPLSINNLKATFDLRFDLNEFESQRLIDFIESKQGIRAFEFSDASDFYAPLIGFCNDYSVNHINKNHYEVAVRFEVDQVPSLLNWKNGSFVNYEIGTWLENTNYEKYDILYFDLNDFNSAQQVIGVNPDGINKLNKFYYASYDHNSLLGVDSQPTDGISPWEQDFFFEPDIGLQNDVQLSILKNEFKNSFVQRVKTKKHVGAINLNYKFTNITTKKALAILHFLENKGGYRRFRLDVKSIYNKPKVFYSPSWTHTWKSFNSHDIEVRLIEDPLGIISKKN